MDTAEARKRVGRPVKPTAPGERASLGLKVTALTKARLDDAAKNSGRTQSQEAEHRLEQTFERQDLLSDVLALTYGRHLAGLLVILGGVMLEAGQGAAMQRGESGLWTKWPDDPEAFAWAAEAAKAVLAAAAPSAEPLELSSEMRAGLLGLVERRLLAVAGDPNVQPFEDYTTLAQLLLGDAAKRMGDRTAGKASS